MIISFFSVPHATLDTKQISKETRTVKQLLASYQTTMDLRWISTKSETTESLQTCAKSLLNEK